MSAVTNIHSRTPVDNTGHYGVAALAALSSEVQMVTPEMARHLRQTCHFERQRPINDRNVKRLAAEMRNGSFISGTPIFIAVLPDGGMVIVNGNHTLEAVGESGVSIPLAFIYRRVDGLDEAGHIYANMDLQKTRTWSDAARAYDLSGGIPMVNYVLPALGVIAAGFKNPDNQAATNQSRDLRFKAAAHYQNAAAMVEAIFRGKSVSNQRPLRRAAFLAVVLATMRYQPSAAVEFWTQAVSDDGLKSNHPAKALLNYGLNHRSAGNADRAEHSRAAALAWNAHFQGRPLEVCKPNAMKEFFLLGTPWHRPQSGPRSAAPAAASTPTSPKLQTGVVSTQDGLKPVSLFVG